MKQVVYVASPESEQIYVWKLNKVYDGILELVQVISTSGQAYTMAVHPNKRFLYVGIRPNSGITTYQINDMGLLTDVGTMDVIGVPTYLSSDIRGAFLYCASYRNNTVSVIPINMSGLLGTPIQIVEGLLGCHSVNIDKSRGLLWVPCLKEHAIRLFERNTCGILKELDSFLIKSNVNSGPRHMTFYDFSYYAYVINELTSTVEVIQYGDCQKIPNIIQSLNIIPANISIKRCWASDIHITPNKRWLYCSDRTANIISCFEVSNDTKQLKFVSYQLTEAQPRGFEIDSQGNFLIVAGQKSNYISLYRINTNNGKLTMLSRYSSGKGPIWVSIVPFYYK